MMTFRDVFDGLLLFRGFLRYAEPQKYEIGRMPLIMVCMALTATIVHLITGYFVTLIIL